MTRFGAWSALLAAAGCTIPVDDPNEPSPTSLWNPTRATPLACTTPHILGGNTGGTDLPNDPTPGNVVFALTPSDVADPGSTAGNGKIWPTLMVQSPAELKSTLEAGFQGTIVIPRDVDWDLTGMEYLRIQGNVALVGERGELCSRPTLRSKSLEKHDMFSIVGSNIRIEGIHFVGPMNGERTKGTMGQTAALNVLVYEDPSHLLEQAGLPVPRHRYIRIRDNEFDNWTAEGVDVTSTRRDETPDDWPDTWEKPTRKFAEEIVIEQNFFHHNSRDGGGYGASVGNGTHASILGNVFEANRHAIASNGRPYSGYLAKFNYVQEGGFRDNGSYQQHFDVHGMGPNHYGGLAGQYYEIANNTFRGEQEYYLVKTRAALELRGRASEGASFHDNVLVHDSLFPEAVRLKGFPLSDPTFYNFTASGNHFDVDYSKELAVGDFDGDGRSDMFLTNGTAWFVSRAGVEPWQFLHASDLRVKDLGFADINNDRVTDVVWTAPDGRLGYLKYGAGEPIWIGTSPVSAQKLRFGDFDGDGKTDVFRRDPNGDWLVLYSGHPNWFPVASSPTPLEQLQFGEFDDISGTDVLSVEANGWSIRSGAHGAWILINGQVKQNLRNAVVADFDGNGRDDVAFIGLNQAWQFSRQGRTPLEALRPKMSGESDAGGRPLYVGRFAKGAKAAQVLTWQFKHVGHYDRQFVLWYGFGGSNLFAEQSRFVMR